MTCFREEMSQREHTKLHFLNTEGLASATNPASARARTFLRETANCATARRTQLRFGAFFAAGFAADGRGFGAGCAHAAAGLAFGAGFAAGGAGGAAGRRTTGRMPGGRRCLSLRPRKSVGTPMPVVPCKFETRAAGNFSRTGPAAGKSSSSEPECSATILPVPRKRACGPMSQMPFWMMSKEPPFAGPRTAQQQWQSSAAETTSSTPRPRKPMCPMRMRGFSLRCMFKKLVMARLTCDINVG